MVLIICERCKINSFDKFYTRKFCDSCKILQKKDSYTKFREKNKTEKIITCIQCNINTFEKCKMRKYCDECKILKQRERSKTYKKNNKDKISNYNKIYKEEHKDEIKEYNKQYNSENRTDIQIRQTKQHRQRRQTDTSYKLILSARSRMYKLVKGINKTNSVTKTIGCDGNFLKQWLKFQFTENMTFENYGSYWHIDHVIPCAKFDISNERDQQECFHWSNLQPLRGDDNNSKK